MKKNCVFISGDFNTLHIGHIRLFKYAKELGNFLIIGLNDSNNETNIVNTKDRLENLSHNNLVDEVIVIKNNLLEVIMDLKPKYILKGKEHEEMINIEESVLNKINTRLVFASGDSNLGESSLTFQNDKNINALENVDKSFLKRHQISIDSLIKIINKFSMQHVAVIGDIIFDEYVKCEPLGMSNEDFLTTYKPLNTNLYLGGAGIVSMHCGAIGSKTDIYSVVGDDKLGLLSIDILNNNSVTTYIYKDDTRPTTKKTRYKFTTNLFRLSDVIDANISKEFQTKIFSQLRKNITKYNLVVLSDFNYGVLTPELINKIIKLCKENNIKVFADTQVSSQIGDIDKFNGVDLLSSTERELRYSYKDKDSGIIELSSKIIKKLNLTNLIVKLGSDGIIIRTSDNNTDKIGALNLYPINVSGAGDSLLVLTSLAFISNATIWESALLGSIAASIQVSREGNIPIGLNEFNTQLAIL